MKEFQDCVQQFPVTVIYVTSIKTMAEIMRWLVSNAPAFQTL
jgi:hypothetical protein